MIFKSRKRQDTRNWTMDTAIQPLDTPCYPPFQLVIVPFNINTDVVMNKIIGLRSFYWRILYISSLKHQKKENWIWRIKKGFTSLFISFSDVSLSLRIIKQIKPTYYVPLQQVVWHCIRDKGIWHLAETLYKETNWQLRNSFCLFCFTDSQSVWMKNNS